MSRTEPQLEFDGVAIADRYDPNADVVLYQGDCMDLLPAIPDATVQLVVTSPPYNIGKEYENSLSLSEYQQFQDRVIAECVRVLTDTGSICWQVGNYVQDGEILPLDVLFYYMLKQHGLKLRNRIVWHFGHGLHCSRRFSGRHETILWFTKGDDYLFNLDAVRVPQKYPGKRYFKGPKRGELSGHPDGKNPGDVWEIPNVKSNHVEKTAHPCQFPVELVERLVLALTDPGDALLDPFAGVGSACAAAVMHGRRALGAEVVPEYAAIARERIDMAAKGQLRVRPMSRPVYEPTHAPRRVRDLLEDEQ